ncbi:MAG: LuxR family transcriptional regulator, maltose regulon positive regulatory protein [Actinomycetota bacterium]|jgi:LuxR family maltose regulon positive regulatory protein|nr:LuxR family transcriptional regulator, maltose regulon positive regulatory protein [Actinomycetota bacterium]
MQGFGKTTLVTGWLESLPPEDYVTIWVSLTPELARREQFVAHLKRRMNSAGLSSVTNPPASPLTELDEALEALDDNRRVVVVIDNVGHLADEALAADLVTLVQRHRNLHLVLCVRAPHPIERLAAGAVIVSTLQTEDLQLTVAEVHELSGAMGIAISQELATQMHAEVGGWIAALRLMIESVRVAQPWQAVAEEYIRNTAMPSGREKAFVDSLMQYSLAERLDVAMVRDLAEPADTGALDAVRVMERPGLLERRFVDGRQVFVFPATLKRMLREGMLRKPEDARAFHRRLATWFAENANPADAVLAFHHAIAGADFELAYCVWSDHVLAMDMTRPELVARTLSIAPPDVLERYPGMAVTKAVSSVIPGDSDVDSRVATVRALVDASDRVVAAGIGGLQLPDLLYVSAGHIIGLRLAGRFDEAAAYGDQVAERAASLRTTQRPAHALTAWLDLQRGLNSTLQGDNDTAIGHYRRAWEYAQLGGPSYVAPSAAANLAMTHTLRGEPARAKLWEERYRSRPTGTYWSDHLVGVGAHLTAAIRALDQLDREGAQVELAVLGDGSDALDLWPYVVYVNAQYGLLFEDPYDTLSAVNRAIHAHEPSSRNAGIAANLIARARADLLTAGGGAQLARSNLVHLDHGNPFFGIPFARLLLLSGEPGSARGLTARLLAREVLTPRDRLDTLIIDAAAAARTGNHGDAQTRIENARTIADETGIRSAFATITAIDRVTLSIALPDSASPRPTYPDHATLVRLSPREQSLLEALSKTSSRNEIAQQQFVSVNTVKTQLARLYSKLGTTTRQDTIAKAQQLGLLS